MTPRVRALLDYLTARFAEDSEAFNVYLGC